MLEHIEAKFSCDKCGAPMVMKIDPAYIPPANWSLFEIAEDAIRWEGEGSVSDARHYCKECTAVMEGEP